MIVPVGPTWPTQTVAKKKLPDHFVDELGKAEALQKLEVQYSTIIIEEIEKLLLDFARTGKPEKRPADPSGLQAATNRLLLFSLLLGMKHAAGPIKLLDDQASVSLLFDDVSRATVTFEEAERFLKNKIPLTRDEFYNLEPQIRFRAFTVSRLTSLDAINRVKE